VFKMKAIVLIILLFQSCIVYAHDESQFEFIGFSYDNRYCAFEIYGYGDPSPGAYSNIYIINVQKNEYVTDPIITESGYSDLQLWKTRSDNYSKANEKLMLYEIDSYNKGEMLFYNIRKDQPVVEQEFLIQKNKYSLQLEMHLFNNDFDMKVAIFDLELYKGIQKVLLQNDKKLPLSRKNANSYRIVTAYYSVGSIAVIIEYEEYGFEGMNKRQMIVTARLEKR
jgi:predicted secreted protein